MPFPAQIDLSNLNGFGIPITHSNSDPFSALADAGDINGDGIDDFLIGLDGNVYLVFGKSNFGSSLNVDTPNGSNGFEITTSSSLQLGTEFEVSSGIKGIGDLNGDGFDDFAISTENIGSGSPSPLFVVFGHAGTFAPVLDLEPSTLNGSNGFTVNGGTGESVSNAGDVNGDGIADFLLGDPSSSPGGKSGAGASYIVYGTKAGFPASLNLSDLNGAKGFHIDGLTAAQSLGTDVAGIGDINRDGVDDFLLSSGESQSDAYVVFGRKGGFGASLDLSSLNGSNGFRVHVPQSQNSSYQQLTVSALGDVNGDGYADFAVSDIGGDADPNNSQNMGGASFVIFGKASGWTPSLDVSALNGTTGFRLDGSYASNDGSSVAAVGDLNGDGLNDIIIQSLFSHRAYVVFGHAGNWASATSLSSLNGSNGFVVTDGVQYGPYGGLSVGDYNSDGVDDLAYYSNTQAALVYGMVGATAVSRTGTIRDDRLNGSTANDTLSGAGGNDSLYGHAGDDKLSGGGGADSMIGGSGNDTYFVDNASDRVIEAVGGGTDTVFAYLSYTLQTGQSVDVLATASQGGTGAINLAGNDLAQTIRGNAGDNGLTAGGGADLLYGFGGNDRYYVGNQSERVFEAVGQGSDTVFASSTYALQNGQSIELLATASQGGTTQMSLSGNELAQRINGNEGINGLYGGAGNDSLYGYGGNDRLVGGAGRDVMDGGAGNDVFAFGAVTDSTGVTRDLIQNMNLDAADKFQFTVKPSGGIHTAVIHGALNEGSSFDANLGAAIHDAAQLGAHQAVLFTPDGGTLAHHVFLILDVNGAVGYQAGADYVVELQGLTGTLTTDDFA